MDSAADVRESPCASRSLTCGNYVGGAFWCDTFEPGVSAEPPECGHTFDYETLPEEDTGPWTTCPKCGGDVDTRG